MTIGIYQIKCIVNDKVYVGSSKDIEDRWKDHISRLKRNNHVNNYLQNSYNKYGLESFVFEIVEECTIELLLEREQYYLDQIFSTANTFNVLTLAGRSLNRVVSQETKDKISKAHIGKVITQGVKDKISKTLIGKKRNPLTDEHKRKISDWSKNNKKIYTIESRRKISEANKGKPKALHSEETKRKIGLKSKNRIPNQETRDKISKALKGRPKPPRTDEHKRKISESKKRKKVEKI